MFNERFVTESSKMILHDQYMLFLSATWINYFYQKNLSRQPERQISQKYDDHVSFEQWIG